MSVFSVMLPFVPRRFAQAVPFAELVTRTSAYRLWQGQATVAEPHQLFAYLAGAGHALPVGTGVTLMPLRHPFEAALQARSLAMATGHPVIAGVGPGATVFQESLGGAYVSPTTAVREYVAIMRRLLDGEHVDAEGRYFTMHGALPSIATPRVSVGVGVLRPRMAHVVGGCADAAITWLTPPSYVADVVAPAVRAGAAEAGRGSPRIVSMVPVAVRRDDLAPEEVVLSSNVAHLSLPHYRAMLGGAGIEVDPTRPADVVPALVAAGAFALGTPEEVARVLWKHVDAGASEVVLNTTGVLNTRGPAAALDDLTRVLAAVEAVGRARGTAR